MGSITDRPISSSSEDLFKVEKYTKALAGFIERSNTPITIGLQGEWGTGKTSLMSMLLENLSDKNIATSWVNTWEYSMFANPNETTPRVLQGMLSQLETSCKEQGHWDIGDDASKHIKSVGRFFSSVANQVVKKQVGIDVKAAVEEVATSNEHLSLMTGVAAIKYDIRNVIDKLINSEGNPFHKVVFFVDDLDRINPADAVEVLESLKNIFDIPHCVFVLAIDYDVVVKGLESKFGPKTELNEREFRSFFDKIIQVPFSMPIGAYDVESFLKQKLSDLGHPLSDDSADMYTKIVGYTVGFNPRSLKRYLNSFSLIDAVRKSDEDESDNNHNDLMLFALLGIQVSYPQVFRLLIQNSEYLYWDKSIASRLGIKWDDVLIKLEEFENNELVDEDWERVTWAVCQKDAYLRSRTFDVLQLLNYLREIFEDDLHDELARAMEFAAITSVDDDLDSKSIQQAGKRIKFSGVKDKAQQLRDQGLPPEGVDSYYRFFKKLEDAATEHSYFRLSLAKTGASFNDDRQGRSFRQLFYMCNPNKRVPGFGVYIKPSVGLKYDGFKHEVSERYGEAAAACVFNKNVDNVKGTEDIFVHQKIFSALGKEKYDELLGWIAQIAIDNTKSKSC